MSDRPATFDAGFRYIKLGKDPAFRQHLRDLGWRNGQTIVMAEPSEPVGEVLRRALDYTDEPAMIAMEMESEPFGFGLIFTEEVERINAAPNVTIGTVYADLRAG